MTPVSRVGTLFAALVVATAAGVAPAIGAPIVAPTVTVVGPLFHYDYTITNDPPGEDIELVDISVLPADATLTNLFAPTGFQAVYDSFLGLVTFLPSLGSPDLFAVGTTLSGFGFESENPPSPSTFQALTSSGGLLVGATEAPGTASVIPEPGTLGLLALGLGALVRRRAAGNRGRRA
jgi:hypothetical protein